jgi:hypothetical protein
MAEKADLRPADMATASAGEGGGCLVGAIQIPSYTFFNHIYLFIYFTKRFDFYFNCHQCSSYFVFLLADISPSQARRTTAP